MFRTARIVGAGDLDNRGTQDDRRDQDRVEVPEGRDRHAAARTAVWGVALPDVQGHVHGHGGDSSGTTPVVVADLDERRHEPVGDGRGSAAEEAPAQAGFVLYQPSVGHEAGPLPG